MRKMMMLSLAMVLSISFALAQNAQKEAQERAIIKQTKKEIKSKTGNLAAEKQKLDAARKELRKLESLDVSILTKDQFYADFGNVDNIVWTKTINYDQVTFTTQEGKPLTAYYTADSQLIGTTKNVSFTDLPVSAQRQIKKDYAAYTVNQVILFEDNEAEPGLVFLYGIQFDSPRSYFLELAQGSKGVVLQVLDSGEVFFCQNIDPSNE